MNNIQDNFIKLLFEKGETICVSHNQFGYHSINIDDLYKDKITLISPNGRENDINFSQINLIAINPISGFRRDDNVTSYRSFLLELDEGSLKEQYDYIEKLKLPNSACVFSGNKSLHYLITLEKPLISKQIWQFYNNWILNVVSKADQQLKNPSRSIRFPMNRRLNNNHLQKLLYIKKRININDLIIWLNKFPNCKPIQKIIPTVKKKFTVQSIPNWVKEILEEGITVDRNKTWFRVAAVLATRNFDYEEVVEILDNFFEEDKDFKRREWITAIKSAFKHVLEN
jgi:hypothetical protein